ncbi:MAG: HDOD domain-containing protein [Tepidiformaceae bacterium]
MTEEVLISFEAQSRLRMIVNRTTELAPLKAVAIRAIALADDERMAAMDLAAIISSDPALAAQLLGLYNSAYYGYARRITNVREAVIMLGMRTVRSVAISSAIIDAFRVPEIEGFDQDLFWAHSVCVGLVAEVIAREARTARPEDAFTAGVLHDVGRLGMMLVEPQRFARVVELVHAQRLTYGEAELAVFGMCHEVVGARLAQRWNFPEQIFNSIYGPHPGHALGTVGSLGEVVAAADLACNRAGLACGFDWTQVKSRQAVDALPPVAELALGKVNGGLSMLEAKARLFLLHATSRVPRWYATHPAVDELAEREAPRQRDVA